MKLPNGENAQLGDKVERYCLNLKHSRGGNKAILFRSRLGITLDNKEILEAALLEAAVSDNAMIYKEDPTVLMTFDDQACLIDFADLQGMTYAIACFTESLEKIPNEILLFWADSAK
ncbi:MAG: hypothetical protein C4288_05525 [Leptolyngbya sp. ERB_1_1]